MREQPYQALYVVFSSNGNLITKSWIALKFSCSNNPESETVVVKLPKKPPTGTIQFRDNIDIMEQVNYSCYL